MYNIIEKIEGQWAIIEWGKDSFKIPKSMLPGNAKPPKLNLNKFANRRKRPRLWNAGGTIPPLGSWYLNLKGKKEAVSSF